MIEVIDHGVTALPPNPASYYAEHQPSMREDLKPISITQPEGVSFTVNGNLVDWQKWQFRIGFDPYEGLVLHQITYDDDGRRRSILHRASISEMVVPYGDPSPLHGWKNAFDAGEWGLGRMTQPLTLGCDCLGEIFYFDATIANEQGKPWVIPNAICMHEEDYGMLWKHVDLLGGRSEVRRSRRLVVSFVATVGNYEYGFYWYFYLDGNIQLEVKLSGIVSPMAIEPGTQPEFANVVGIGVAAPHHQHMFNARLDFDVDGPVNEVYEVEAEPLPPGPDNPWMNAFRQRSTRLDTELAARRDTDAAHSRTWRIANPEVRNGLDQPVAYKLVPTMTTPTLLAHPGVADREARRLRAAQPLGHAVRARGAARRGRVPQPTLGRRRSAALDRAGPGHRRHRRGGLVLVRGDALRAARGLAGDAGRVHGLHADAVRLLRSQPLRSTFRRVTRVTTEGSDGEVDAGRTAARARSLRRGRAAGRKIR